MAKKSSGNNKLSTAQEIRRLGVIVERVHDDVQLVAEQYGDIQKTLDRHTEILDRHTEILDRHTEILDRHAETIGHVAEDLEIVKIDTGFIKGSLKKKVDIEEFSALERRVAALEKRRG